MAKRKVQKKPTIAMIGYGSQGRAMALNLRDSGYPVCVGLRARSKSRHLVRRDGFSEIRQIPEAVRRSDIICFAFPDHLHGRVFDRDIAPHLCCNATLWFLHGTSVHFGAVKPPKGTDVILIAPHAPGVAVREEYLGPRSIAAFYSVHRNHTRKARSTITSLAQAVGIRPGSLIKTTFEDEAVGDLFGEQAVLCGGLAMLIKSGFEVLVENGHKPEHAYLEVAYQLDLIIDLIKKHGIEGMFSRISVAAQFGSLETGPRIINASVKTRMEAVLKGIKSGKFTRKLNLLEEKEIAEIYKALKTLSHPALEKAARKFSK
ncbi:MAG: ketol-acid reductoisomerase [bacterium]|nr:ketol-acid reductoisomerase [bacterium]